MCYGFVKTAAVSPILRIADPQYNAANIIEELRKAEEKQIDLLVFPELAISSCSCGDLFRQRALISECRAALENIAEATKSSDILTVVGLPYAETGKLYNCAAVICSGKILGIVTKKYLSNGEERYFATYQDTDVKEIDFCGYKVPFGNNVVFRCKDHPDFVIGVEIGDELLSVIQPSQALALNGATVICNPCAILDSIGRKEYIRDVVKTQSGRLIAAYVLSNASGCESSTDAIYSSAFSCIYENGNGLVENALDDNEMIVTDIDIESLVHDRMKNSGFNIRAKYNEIVFEQKMSNASLTRTISKHPFVPLSLPHEYRNLTVFDMQVKALKKRVSHIGCKSIVVGISGGLDSCLALLVMSSTISLLGRPMTDIIAVTMPCFGTTKRTKSNAQKMCEALGVTFKEIDISAAVLQHFEDIGHNQNVFDVTYENCQARERTQVLMDIANKNGGIVIGTGDLSELALGWATYNGDHMSMYGVNAGVPKTLIRQIVRDYADNNCSKNPELKAALYDILDTPVSPELIPPKDGEISQVTEDIVGPYELHDFYLYYFVRYGFTPEKILFLAETAFGDEYDRATLEKWMRNFVKRFITQQFKRSCLPDGPKIGSVSLSPRGDWKMPSDASFNVWNF